MTRVQADKALTALVEEIDELLQRSLGAIGESPREEIAEPPIGTGGVRAFACWSPAPPAILDH